MAFKLPGHTLPGIQQKGYKSRINEGKPGAPKTQDKNETVSLSKHEKEKGTMITGGSLSEKIIDLEMRIEDLNSDLKGGGKEGLTVVEKGKIITQINKLKAELKRISKDVK